MGVVFGLLAALSIGLSDLFGRRVVHRTGPISAAVPMQALAFLTSAVTLVFISSEWSAGDLIIGLLSGVGLGAGLGCYFAGLNRASSALVAPPVATLSAVVPLAYSVLRGSSPSVLSWLGTAVCLTGLVLITVGSRRSASVAVGLLWGVLSGLGYGFGLSIVLEASDASGSWPAVSQRFAAFFLLLGIARRRGTAAVPPVDLRLWAVLAGVMAGLSTVFYLLGVAVDETSAVVAASLFPAVSVVVGRRIYGDEVRVTQAIGVGVVIIGVIAVALG
ncbi:MAG: DMT family transporter [Acidimicrobiales bacterium]|nr:DMT family transporter [Acidimicrobiales bacterium]